MGASSKDEWWKHEGEPSVHERAGDIRVRREPGEGAGGGTGSGLGAAGRDGVPSVRPQAAGSWGQAQELPHARTRGRETREGAGAAGRSGAARRGDAHERGRGGSGASVRDGYRDERRARRGVPARDDVRYAAGSPSRGSDARGGRARGGRVQGGPGGNPAPQRGQQRKPRPQRDHRYVVPQLSPHAKRSMTPQVLHPGRNEQIPQIRDNAARHGGWNLPSLTARRSSGGFGSGRAALPWRLIVLVVAAIALVVLLVRGVVGCVGALAPAQTEPQEQTAATTETAPEPERPAAASASGDVPAYTTLDAGRTTASGSGRMSFSAVGDNIANENLLKLADAWAGSTGDGEYDFAPFYAEVAPFLQSRCDVSFINQETTLGGAERYEYMGYPSFNTPDSMAKAVAEAGWRVVGLNTNHTYDTWTPSIEHAQQVWAGYPGLMTTGSYASAEDRQSVRMVECNGVRVAVLAYCYGQNGYEQSDLPNDYYAVPWDADAMRADVERARKVADAVLVYMHWGKEYDSEPTDTQREQAQALADAGVDIVIGSHAHVIQPVEWVERSGGGKMLCAYGLGDFLSGYVGHPSYIMSGMLTWDFVRTDGSKGGSEGGSDANPTSSVTVENVVWHPLVEHMVDDTDTVRFAKDYTDEEAEANALLRSLDAPRQWLVDTTRSIVGDAVEIDV